MPNEFWIILISLIGGFLILGLLIRQWIKQSQELTKPDEVISTFLKSFDSRSIAQTNEIREQTRTLNERLDNAARIIGQVQKNIGEFSEIGRNMRDLQDFLKSPKLRGNIGEEVLTDLIGQMFPKNSYQLQYAFKSGVRVDVAIKTEAGILPIDAKFPLENYLKLVNAETKDLKEQITKELIRDVKNHIQSIAQKYILPQEKTLDFALMYVPSEAVFYEVIQLPQVTSFAKKCRVYPVSPTTLYAHLQIILLSFAGKQVEQKSREVFQILRAMIIDYEKVDGNLGLLGKHLINAFNQLHQVTQSFTIFGQKLKSTQSLDESATVGVLSNQ